MDDNEKVIGIMYILYQQDKQQNIKSPIMAFNNSEEANRIKNELIVAKNKGNDTFVVDTLKCFEKIQPNMLPKIIKRYT